MTKQGLDRMLTIAVIAFLVIAAIGMAVRIYREINPVPTPVKVYVCETTPAVACVREPRLDR